MLLLGMPLYAALATPTSHVLVQHHGTIKHERYRFSDKKQLCLLCSD